MPKSVQEMDHSNESDNETLFTENETLFTENEPLFTENETFFIEKSSGIIAVSSSNQPGVRPRHVLLTVCRYDLDFTNLPMKHRQSNQVNSIFSQLPLCDDNGRSQGLCDIDPSKLLLEHVSQQFHGNFSCQGNNGAGWSRVSRERELQIYCEYENRLPE